jgi:glycosyltransferase involved in cell wall biosynthesis
MAIANILIIASRADIAGGENYLLSCLKYLDRDRYHPIVWLPGDGTFRTALEQARVEYVIEPVNYGWLKPPMAWYGFLSGLPTRVRKITDLIRERGIQIVHTNSNQILEGALAAKLAGVQHLYLAHIDFQSNLPVYQRFPLDAASFACLMDDLSTGIIAVSEHVRDTLCPPLQRERVRVVNNGLEMARYDAALAVRDGQLRQSLGLSDDAVIVVAAGRVTEDKGFDLLIEAAGQLASAHPSAVFLLCGPVDSQEYQSVLLSRIEQLGLTDSVRLLGRRNDLPDVMAQSDVFVLSSRREGHPYVLLEAMACKLPAVATCCGGVDETVVEGETGFVVPIGSAQALAERLAPLLEDAGMRKRIGEAAGKRVREHFVAEKTARGLFDMYEHLLAQPLPAAGSYSVDLLLQAATEYGYLGERLTALEERVKKTERAATLLLDNSFMRMLRKILKG